MSEAAAESELSESPSSAPQAPLLSVSGIEKSFPGVRALSAACDAVMIGLGDQPQVMAEDLRALVAAYEGLTQPSILVPQFDGRRGNPIIFAVRHVPEVLRGTVRVGCRRLIENHADEVAAVEMASDVFTTDCDTPEEYAELLRRLGGRPR